jgi:EAL domain-containing protein (putative c-di-GMP-specific phosphodiesterase class I)
MEATTETVRTGATPTETIDRILTLARRQLGMDVAFVSAIENGLEKVGATDGDAESFGLDGGIAIPLEESYCNLMIKGELANVVPDARNDPHVSDLAVTTSADIGAYIGVPVHLWDGRLYGTLCCLNHAADPLLDERDVRFLQVLAAVIGDQVEYQMLQDERKIMLSDRVQEALSQGVDMVFQPVFDLEQGEVFAYEALARFPLEPYRPPSDWFADAAEVGLGVELELAAIESALSRLDKLPGKARLAVNVSPLTALSPSFFTILAPRAKRVIIEVTEHERVEDYDALNEALAPLRDLGAWIAIDDVGAGFASLSHILRLAPDIVKLDLSLTRGIAADPARDALASSLVDFASGIDATIGAEGIETQSELDRLRVLKVRYGQGFHLGVPSALSGEMLAEDDPWEGEDVA